MRGPRVGNSQASTTVVLQKGKATVGERDYEGSQRAIKLAKGFSLCLGFVADVRGLGATIGPVKGQT